MSTLRPISRVVRLPEFERDFKRLRKKYRTLESDLDNFIEYALKLFHEKGLQTGRIEPVAGLGFDEPPVYVAKKFACQALKSKGARTGIRIVWAWFPVEGRIELAEIYLKADKDVEDRQRLKKRYARVR